MTKILQGTLFEPMKNKRTKFCSMDKEVHEWVEEDSILKLDIAFARLPEIEPAEIAEHMSDPRVAEYMPLLNFAWNAEVAAKFVAMKEERWARDGLGHWAFLANGRYVGWGGFQKEGEEWDFGLVLRPDTFGLGRQIAKQAIDFAIADARIPYVTFLLPPSRRNLRAIERFGARQTGEVEYDGARFLKFILRLSDRSA